MCIPDRDNKPVGNGRKHTAVGGDETKQKKLLLYRDIKSIFMSGLESGLMDPWQ